MNAEDFIEINYHTKIGLEADKLIEDKTGKEVSFEEIAEAYHEYKFKLFAIPVVIESVCSKCGKPKMHNSNMCSDCYIKHNF